MKRIILAALAFIAGGASAQSLSVSGNVATYVPPVAGKPYVPLVSAQPSGGVLLRDLLKMPSQSLGAEVTASRLATASAARAAGARALAIVIPGAGVLGAGMLLYDLYNRYRITPDGAGGLVMDPGVPEVTRTLYCVQSQIYACGPSTEAAIDSFIAQLPGGTVYQACVYGGPALPFTPSYYRQGGYVMVTQPCGGAPAIAYHPQFTETSLLACESGQAKGADGLCTNPDPNAPKVGIAPGAAADYVGAHPDPTPWNLPEVVKEAAGRGISPETSPPAMSGPATKVGDPKVTTTTDPQGVVTTKTETPKATYTYNGDTVTWNISNTTITNVGGAVTTTIEELPPEDKEDPCVKNPERVACRDLGTPVDEPAPQREDIPLQAPAHVFASSAGCPAGVAFSIYGKAYSISFEPLCDVMTWLRPIFLALGAAAAAFIFMQGFRT